MKRELMAGERDYHQGMKQKSDEAVEATKKNREYRL